MNICDYGFIDTLLPENAQGIPARVTAVHKDRFRIVSGLGEGFARLKTKEYYKEGAIFPTAGDFVLIRHISEGDSLIIATLPRRTVFYRRQPGPVPVEQAVAANFDYVFIMQSLNLDFNPRRLERYLTLAWQSGAIPVVLLTKADLLDDYSEYLFQARRVAAGV